MARSVTKALVAAPVALLLGLSVVVPLAGPAHAASLGAPVVSVDPGPPVAVSWSSVDGASKYRVVFTGPDSPNPIDSFETESTVATPRIDLPLGLNSVAVNAVDGANVNGAVDTEPFTVSQLAGPVLIPPTTNVEQAPGNVGPAIPTVKYPTPPVLAWQPVAGAKTYDVKVSSTGTTLAYTTSATSIVPTDALALAVQGQDKVWDWEVRSRNSGDVLSAWSSASFRVTWPAAPSAPAQILPTDDLDEPIDKPDTPAVTDTTLSWSPFRVPCPTSSSCTSATTSPTSASARSTP